MTLAQQMQNIRAELERRVAEIQHAAPTAGQPGSPWPELHRRWTSSPTTNLCRSGTGARPDDVREVLQAVVRHFEPQVEALRSRMASQSFEGADELDDALWALRHRRLARLVDDELRAYTARVAPPIGLDALFANAASSAASRRAANPIPETPSVQTLVCGGCGSPRFDADLRGACPACGRPFFAPSPHASEEDR
jgi:hypothetical protein